MLDKGFGQSFLNPLHNQLELIGITGKEQVSGDPTATSRQYIIDHRPHITGKEQGALQQADNTLITDPILLEKSKP